MTIPNESQTDLIHGMSRAQPGVADKAGRVTEESSAARLIRTRHTQLGPGTTIDDFLTECRAVWRRSIDLRGSLESYESAVTHHILPFFHGTAIRDWDTLLIIAFIKELNGKAAMTGKKTLFRDGRKLTKTAKKRILAILSGICSLAIVNGLLDDNPAKNYGRLLKQYGENPSEDDETDVGHARARPIHKCQALTIEERDRVLMSARTFLSPRYYAYFLFLAGTGVRPGEGSALRWKHLDLDGRDSNGVPIANIRTTFKRGGKHIGKTKSGRSRRVQLDPAVVESLKSLRSLVSPSEKDFVFRRLNGRPFDEGFRTQVWAVILGLSGLTRWLPLYCLRHTYASVLISCNVSITFVSQQLGHYNDEVTRITYFEWLPDAATSNLSPLRLRS